MWINHNLGFWWKNINLQKSQYDLVLISHTQLRNHKLITHSHLAVITSLYLSCCKKKKGKKMFLAWSHARTASSPLNTRITQSSMFLEKKPTCALITQLFSFWLLSLGVGLPPCEISVAYWIEKGIFEALWDFCSPVSLCNSRKSLTYTFFV